MKKKKPIAIPLPPLMPPSIYARQGEECDVRPLPIEQAICRGIIPIEPKPDIPPPEREETRRIPVDPLRDDIERRTPPPPSTPPPPPPPPPPTPPPVVPPFTGPPWEPVPSGPWEPVPSGPWEKVPTPTGPPERVPRRTPELLVPDDGLKRPPFWRQSERDRLRQILRPEVSDELFVDDIPYIERPRVTLPPVKALSIRDMQELVQDRADRIDDRQTFRDAQRPRINPLAEVYIQSRTFRVESIPGWILDFGDQTYATFGYETGTFVPPPGSAFPPINTADLPFLSGFNISEIPTEPLFINSPTIPLFTGPRPTSEERSIRVDTNCFNIVRDVSISIDAFADFASGVVTPMRQTLNSYMRATNLLRSGEVIINGYPFPTVIPITSGMSCRGGIRVFRRVDRPSAFLNVDDYSMSVDNTSTHSVGSPRIEVILPRSGTYTVEVAMPNKAINSSGAYDSVSAQGIPGVYAWPFTVTLTIERRCAINARGEYEYGPVPRPGTGNTVGHFVQQPPVVTANK